MTFGDDASYVPDPVWEKIREEKQRNPLLCATCLEPMSVGDYEKWTRHEIGRYCYPCEIRHSFRTRLKNMEIFANETYLRVRDEYVRMTPEQMGQRHDYS